MIKILIYALTALSIMECLVGLFTQNVHILRDFLVTVLLLASIIISQKALQQSSAQADSKFTLGYRRMDLLAAFCNCVYIQCMELFEFLETFHHMIEHWEEKTHE